VVRDGNGSVAGVGGEDVELDRLGRLTDLNDGRDPDWRVRFAPGSFGCHELLDRTSLAVNAVEDWILSHPACLNQPQWFALARAAADALNELYRRVGEAHLDDGGDRGT
jgi:hypothetical protein